VGTLSHQNKILAKTPGFQLVQRKKGHKKWYEVKCLFWTIEELSEVCDFFDPNRNRAGNWATTWKYKNRKDAEQMFLTATLRWA
jgi:hypothetical protein